MRDASDVPASIGKEPGKRVWTAAFFRSQMRGAWRRIWQRWPGRNLVMQSARVEILIRKKSGEGYKKAVWYQCSGCPTLGKPMHTPKQTAEVRAAKKIGLDHPPHIPHRVWVDHKDPLVPTDGTTLSWDEYLHRLFCGPEHLQVLCTPCHRLKTREENTERRTNVKARQDSI